MTAAAAEQITTDHRNEVYLVGEVITAPDERTFSDGRDVVTFRLDVRAQADSRPIRDSFDITVAGARTRKFHRVGAGSRAFVVIEAARAKRLRR